MAEAGTTVELRLRKEAAASGQVTDAKGRPLADVKVSLAHDPYVSHETEGEARSDQDGRFSFTSLPAGRYRLVAAHEGYREMCLEVSLPAPRFLVALERRKLAKERVAGRVVGEGDRPIEGAAVRVGSQGGVTDRFGRFEIGEVADGMRQVSATAGDDSTEREVPVAGGTTPELLLRLGGGLSIRGRVTDSGNRPQGAVSIRARPLLDGSTRSEERPGKHATESRSDGRFEIGGLEPGVYEPSVSRSWHYAGEGIGGVSLYGHGSRARAGDADVRIEVAGLYSIAGRVVGEHGEPIPEFNIEGGGSPTRRAGSSISSTRRIGSRGSRLRRRATRRPRRRFGFRTRERHGSQTSSSSAEEPSRDTSSMAATVHRSRERRSRWRRPTAVGPTLPRPA